MSQAKQVLVKQIKGLSGRNKTVRAAMQSLGLGRIGASCKLPLNPSVQGALRAVKHLVSIESV